jgi:two-component system response regulator ChvI
MPTIAIIDNNRGVLALLNDLFEAEGFHVLLYINGMQAFEAFESRLPDVVISEIKLPTMDGFELLRRLRHKSDVPLIFLTGRADEADEIIGLRLGADGFVRKPFSHRLLVERVKTVLRRYPWGAAAALRKADQTAIERGHLWMDKERYICTWKGLNVDLTKAEFRLLEALAIRPGTVKSRDALMEIALEDRALVHPRRVDNHIRRVRKKFRAVDEKFNEIKSQYSIGYRFGRQ